MAAEIVGPRVAMAMALAVVVVCILAVASEAHVHFGTGLPRGAMSRVSECGRKEVAHVKVTLCETCLQLSRDEDVAVVNSETAQKITRFVDQIVCCSLQRELQQKCERLVNSYVPEMVSSHMRSGGACFESGVCAFPDDQKACIVCQDLASDALKYLENNKTRAEIVIALHAGCAQLKELRQQCDLLVDLYTPQIMEQLENLTPRGFCQLTRMCKPPSKRMAGNDCAMCQFVILELKIKLKDPRTQEIVLDALTNGCDRVQNHVDECKALVIEYGPFILANLDKILDSQALCCKAGFCKSGSCPEKARVWVETVAALSDVRPRIELPHEGLGASSLDA